jgi:hypothetical protein
MIEDLKTEISELSVRDKIELLNCLYHDLSGHGTDGDTELAHINVQEAAILKALGGSGTVNEITGLRQYGKGGGSPAPAPSSTSTTQEIPEELKPYITDILGKSQAIQEKRTAEGYRPYQGQSLAEFTPEQQRAMQGISGLVGTSQQYLDPAARLTAASAMTPTSGEVSQYMSPYMQQVVDIQQREARRQADVSGQQLASEAVQRGGFGGSRQAILEAEAGRNLQTQLGDIQARGLAGAYEDAQRRLGEQRQRQLAGGAQFAQMAPTAVSTGLQELGALQQAGGMRQAQSQAALDIARQQFEAEKAFPEQTLQQYSSIIRGYAMDPSRTTTTYTPAPSTLQQIAGLGTTALAGGKAFGLFKEGGKVGDGKGLASIIVKRQAGGTVEPTQIELLRAMSPEELMAASNDPNFSKVLVDRVLKEKEPVGKTPPSWLTTPLKDTEFGQGIKKFLTPPTLEQRRQGAIERGDPLAKPPVMEEPTGQTANPATQVIDFAKSLIGEDSAKAPQVPTEEGVRPPPQRRSEAPAGTTSPLQGPTSSRETSAPQGQVPMSTTPSIDRLEEARKIRDEAMAGLEGLAEKQKVAVEKGKEGIEQQKWLELANLGINILAQPGGQTFLQTLGKGAKEAGTIQNLAKLSDKEQQISKDILAIDEKTLMRNYGFSKEDVDTYFKQATLDLKKEELAIDSDYKAGMLSAKDRELRLNALQDQQERLDKTFIKDPTNPKEREAIAKSTRKTLESYSTRIADPKIRVQFDKDLKDVGKMVTLDSRRQAYIKAGASPQQALERAIVEVLGTK